MSTSSNSPPIRRDLGEHKDPLHLRDFSAPLPHSQADLEISLGYPSLDITDIPLTECNCYSDSKTLKKKTKPLLIDEQTEKIIQISIEALEHISDWLERSRNFGFRRFLSRKRSSKKTADGRAGEIKREIKEALDNVISSKSVYPFDKCRVLLSNYLLGILILITTSLKMEPRVYMVLCPHRVFINTI